MKRLTAILFLMALLIPAASLAAYDHIGGGRLDLNLELPEFYGSTAAVSTENAALAWYRGSWGPAANIELEVGVAAELDFMVGLTNDVQFSWHGMAYSVFPEMDSLAFYGHAGRFGYKALRQAISDPAGLIIDAPVDGANLDVYLGRHVITAGVAYTGLTFRESAQFYMTELDMSDAILSAGRMVEYLSWNMTAVTEWLNLSAYFLASQEVSSADDRSDYGTEAFNPMYLELLARGFLGESFLYDLSLVGQYGTYGSSTVMAGIGRLGFSWLPGGPSRLGIDLIASTGDSWSDRNGYLLGGTVASDLNQYNPVSIVSTQGYVIEFEVGNLSSLGLFFARKPRDTFSWELRTTTFLRNTDGPVSSSLVKVSSPDGSFLGQELLASWFWRPRSDFGWDLKLGLMYTGEPIQLESYMQDYYLDEVPLMFRLGFDWSWSF